MKTRGITTTGADFWAHLFPESERLYWWPVAAFAGWKIRHKGALRDGRSKDGTVTGSGWLLPKDAPFVKESKVPPRMLAEFDWPRGTDRQRGLWGEEVLYWMLLVGELRPPVWAVKPLKTRREQYEIGDFELSFAPRPVFELKVEGAEYADSANLFVQFAEGGHKATLARVEGKVVNNVTPLPGFEE